jgi:Rha family phage regulatory protein
MDGLTVIVREGQILVDSREAAEMTNVRHADLLEKIDGYIAILNQNGEFRSDLFFIESSYQAGTGKEYKCYLLTRKGCDMVANKMTGEKGVLFTAAYVTKFEEMERQINQPRTHLEILQASIAQLVEQERRLVDVENRMAATERKQDNLAEIISLNPVEWKRKVSIILNKIAKSRGGHTEAYQDIRKESYKLLEDRAACKLSIRLNNRRQKMSLEGVAKSKIDKTNKMDVIADDARLTEIYLAVVKEMAIKYQVELEESSVVNV